MRAAALLSVATIAIGAYLMIAATFALSPMWIALGVLGIAVSTAVAIVSAEQRAATSR